MKKRSSALSKATTKDPCGLEITNIGDGRIEVLKAVAELRASNPCLAGSLPMDFDRLSGLARVKERTKQVAERKVHRGAERMTQSETIVTAWNNGAHHSSGAGYGVKLTTKDRDAYLKREWGRVEIYLPGRANPTKVNVEKDSLWGHQCRELISHEIGKWLLATGMAPWPKGLPPKFRFFARSERTFELRPISGNGRT